jgi:hypothetical protein
METARNKEQRRLFVDGSPSHRLRCVGLRPRAAWPSKGGWVVCERRSTRKVETVRSDDEMLAMARKRRWVCSLPSWDDQARGWVHSPSVR